MRHGNLRLAVLAPDAGAGLPSVMTSSDEYHSGLVPAAE